MAKRPKPRPKGGRAPAGAGGTRPGGRIDAYFGSWESFWVAFDVARDRVAVPIMPFNSEAECLAEIRQAEEYGGFHPGELVPMYFDAAEFAFFRGAHPRPGGGLH